MSKATTQADMFYRHAMLDAGRILAPQAIRFFNPNSKFLEWAADRAADRIVYDVGAGQGHVSIALRALGVKSIGIDLRESDVPGATVIPADGTSYNYERDSVVMLCRPCHGYFPAAVIDRAIERGVREVWYVGLAKNISDDLYGHRKRFKCAVRGAGEDGESVRVMGVDR